MQCKERRLACAGGPDDADHLAVADLHVDAPEDLELPPHVSERLFDVAGNDDRVAHGGGRRSTSRVAVLDNLGA